MQPCLFITMVSILLAVSKASPSEHNNTLVQGNAVVRRKAGNSEIVITTTDRLAGAIHSLKWGGKEFIDSTDHGRQLQSAASFDVGKSSSFWPECFNPTEAGSRLDGAGRRSSSRLVRIQATSNVIRTTTQMAFWLAPNETSAGKPALNKTVLSNYFHSKKVTIGYKQLAHAIEYEVLFTVPKTDRHSLGQFEALTGYMPAEFNKFLRLNLKTRELERLDDGPGEQKYPVILATDKGTHAMGVYSPDQPSKGYEEAGYGRFRFKEERVNKWNCVFRVRNSEGIATGEYRYRMFVAVGSLDIVKSTLLALSDEFKAK